MIHPRMLDPEAAAAVLGVTKTTLLEWRRRKVGPPFYRLEGLIRYSESDLLEWVQAGKVTYQAVPA